MFYKIKKIIPKQIFKTVQPYYHFILNFLASLYYQNPSNKIIVIGITGTTGKTTIVYLIAKMLENAGFRVGYTSTALLGDGKKEWLNNKKMTMLGRFYSQKILSQMVKNKCQYAIVETTSQGIEQFRHRFINYDILVFSGLYPEHIEAHGSFENYKKAKGKLFAHLKKCKSKKINQKIKKTIIVNKDDKNADYFSSFWSEEKIEVTNQLNTNSIYNHYSLIDNNKPTTSFRFKDTEINLKILGDFNAINAALTAYVGLTVSLNVEQIKKGLESIKNIPGRLETIDEGQDFKVIVDYAFEPVALEKLYKIVKKIKHNKIIHVLGSAGGGRDKARRPKLGKLAGKFADFVIITNEDPYDEDPNEIINQVATGVLNEGKKENQNLFKIEDRRQAIKKAIDLAQTDDIVLITGKGCEQAICVANEKMIEWDDRQVVRGLLKK